MERIELQLTDEQFATLHRKPASKKSADIGRLAIALTELHFRVRFPGCRFDYELNGADLNVFTTDDVINVEVKGTEKLDNIWSGLVVNGKDSHDHLLKGMPVYRVTGVYERTPVIYVLRHNEDFVTEPEPRWRVKRLKSTASPTPKITEATISQHPD